MPQRPEVQQLSTPPLSANPLYSLPHPSTFDHGHTGNPIYPHPSPFPSEILPFASAALAPPVELFNRAWALTINRVQSEMARMHTIYTSLITTERQKTRALTIERNAARTRVILLRKENREVKARQQWYCDQLDEAWLNRAVSIDDKTELMEKLRRLESENIWLRAENDRLKGEKLYVERPSSKRRETTPLPVSPVSNIGSPVANARETKLSPLPKLLQFPSPRPTTCILATTPCASPEPLLPLDARKREHDSDPGRLSPKRRQLSPPSSTSSWSPSSLYSLDSPGQFPDEVEGCSTDQEEEIKGPGTGVDENADHHTSPEP